MPSDAPAAEWSAPPPLQRGDHLVHPGGWAWVVTAVAERVIYVHSRAPVPERRVVVLPRRELQRFVHVWTRDIPGAGRCDGCQHYRDRDSGTLTAFPPRDRCQRYGEHPSQWQPVQPHWGCGQHLRMP